MVFALFFSASTGRFFFPDSTRRIVCFFPDQDNRGAIVVETKRDENSYQVPSVSVNHRISVISKITTHVRECATPSDLRSFYFSFRLIIATRHKVNRPSCQTDADRSNDAHVQRQKRFCTLFLELSGKNKYLRTNRSQSVVGSNMCAPVIA